MSAQHPLPLDYHGVSKEPHVNPDEAKIRAWTFIACMGMLFVAIVLFAVIFLGIAIFF